MTRWLLIGLFALAVSSPARPDDADPEPPAAGAKALEGTWELVKVLGDRNGPPPGAVTVTFKKGQMIISRGKREDKTHKVVLDPKKKPAHMDIVDEDRGKKLQGIYKLDNGELSICIGEKIGRRPTTFDGSEEMVVVLKKQK